MWRNTFHCILIYLFSYSLLTFLFFRIQRRCEGEPVAYLIGEKEFHGKNFCVSSSTLIPRPETELLVERALQILKEADLPSEKSSLGSVLELGLGSGCILFSLLLNCPTLKGVGVDISSASLSIAFQNALRLLSPSKNEVCWLTPSSF